MKPTLLLLLIFSLTPGLAAAQAVDLYSGEVPVEDQSQAEREAAFPQALGQVLGKLSGLRHFEERPEVLPALQDARSLVVSFHYQQVQAGGEGGASPRSNTQVGETQTYLVSQFSQPEVDELMRQLGLPRWPPAREPLEIWLLIDDGVTRRVMPVEYNSLRDPLNRIAEQRGLPLNWPEAGEEGEYGVDVQLLWGGYTDALSPQGNPGNVLVVAARREGPEWNLRMTLEYGGEQRSWRTRNIDLAEALTQALHQVVDEIAAAQAIALVDQGSWVHAISVSGMTSAEDYTRCLAYLASLSVVDEVEVEGADPGAVRMSVKLNAAPHYFDQAVSEDGVLEYVETSGQYVLQR